MLTVKRFIFSTIMLTFWSKLQHSIHPCQTPYKCFSLQNIIMKSKALISKCYIVAISQHFTSLLSLCDKISTVVHIRYNISRRQLNRGEFIVFTTFFEIFVKKKSISERLRGRRMPKIYFSKL